MKMTRTQKRDKHIRKVGKINIIPHIILTIIYIIIAEVITLTIVSTFANYVAADHLAAIDTQAETLVEIIENTNDPTADTLSFYADNKAFSDFVIVDEDNNIILSTYDQELAFDELNYKDLEYNWVVATENTCLSIDVASNQSGFAFGFDSGFKNLKDLKSSSIEWNRELKSQFEELIKSKTISPNKIRAFVEGISLKTNIATIPTWNVKKIWDKYTLYYKGDVELTATDISFFTAIALITDFISFIPFCLYIITLIIGIVKQKRSANAIYLDAVTGAKNWMFFRFQAERILKINSKRKKKKYVLVNLRMDRYSSYAMCYGEEDGKILIEKMSTALHEILKKQLCARFSDAEFVMLLPYVSDQQITDQVKSIINELKKCANDRKIEFSAGLCMTGDELNVDKVNNNAVNARKTINSDSLVRIAWFNEELKEAEIWERFVEEHMEAALKNGEFKVYIQPKYNASTREIGGGEALIRWISPTEGFIGPGKFIPIFEKNGFITQIDDFMIESVAKLQAKWISEGKNVVPVSVNVSRAHFTRDDLAEHITSIVEKANAPKEVIELELTESAFFNDREVLINTVQKLRDYGFKVSMDDFGADYSSLNSLKDMPLDVIKLDAGFFRGKESSAERGSVIVAGVISLAKNLGMHIVAEGIEEANQVEFLAEHGCDLIQGFYFAKPMPVEEYEKNI